MKSKSIQVFQTGVLGVNTCVVPLEEDKVFVVDPADMAGNSSNAVLNYMEKNSLECVAVLLTHGHFDHITGILPIKNAFPRAVVAIHKNDACELGAAGVMNCNILEDFGMDILLEQLPRQPKPDVCFNGGETLFTLLEKACGSACGAASNFSEDVLAAAKNWKIIHTPGHSPGSSCFYNESEKILISGDTLFYRGWGRTDMYGGNEAELQKSLNLLNKAAMPEAKVFPGHGDFGFMMKENL